MRPLNYNTPVLDEEGDIHDLIDYIEENGGGSGGDISDAIPSFTSDDNIQNPSSKISMPLFKSGNAMKDLLRWISKAFQNIRYLLKTTETISDDLNTTIEIVNDIEGMISDEYDPNRATPYEVGDFCIYDNILKKCILSTSGVFNPICWENTKIDNEISELNTKRNWKRLGVYNTNNAINLSNIWDKLTEINICVVCGVSSNVQVCSNILWDKTMGNGIFTSGYYYSNTYYSCNGFEINIGSKTLQRLASWSNSVNNGIPYTDIKYYVSYR